VSSSCLPSEMETSLDVAGCYHTLVDLLKLQEVAGGSLVVGNRIDLGSKGFADAFAHLSYIDSCCCFIGVIDG